MSSDTPDTDDDVTPVNELADDVDPSDVWDTDHDSLGVYEVQRHRNGDQTILQLSSFGDGYQIIAFEVDSAGRILETEVVKDGETLTDGAQATSACWYWTDQHPKGILGEAPDDGSGGLLAGLGDLFGGNE